MNIFVQSSPVPAWSSPIGIIMVKALINVTTKVFKVVTPIVFSRFKSTYMNKSKIWPFLMKNLS